MSNDGTCVAGIGVSRYVASTTRRLARTREDPEDVLRDCLVRKAARGQFDLPEQTALGELAVARQQQGRGLNVCYPIR